VVDDLRQVDGFTGAAIAQEMALYEESIAQVPQTA
jgi:hypothetical protein